MKSLLDRPDAESEPRIEPPPGGAKRGRLVYVSLVIGLLLVGAALRLARLDLVQYREDDDALWNIVTRIAKTGSLPITGMHSSIGLPNGPFQAWLLAPFGLIGASPPIMTAGVGLLNVLGIAFVYGFARDFFGRRVALLSLVLIAVNPWAVVLSRRLWGDDLVAPWAALTLWMLARWLYRRDGRALVVGAASLAIVCQVYIVGLEWLVVAAVAVALSGRRLWSRWAAAAAAVFALLVAPYAVGAALPRLTVLSNIGGAQPGHAPVFDLTSIKFALELASNEGYQSFALQGGSVLDATSGVPGAFAILARLFYVVGLVLCLWVLLRGSATGVGQRRGLELLFLVAVVVPSIALLRHSVPVYPYYLVASCPAPYVLSARAIDWLWSCAASPGDTARSAIRALLVAGVGGVVAVNLALAGVFFSVAGDYYQGGNYGMPWRMVDRLARETRQLEANLDSRRILVLEHDEDPNVLFRSLSQHAAPMNGGGTSSDTEFDDRRMLVLSGQPALYVAMGNDRAEQELASSFGSYQVREEKLPGEGVTLRWYALPPAFVIHAPGMPAHDLGWNMGGMVHAHGAQITNRIEPGQPAEVTFYLETPVQLDPTVPNFSLFAHLVRSDGKAIAQKDEPAWETVRWRPGDQIVQWLTLDVPASVEPGLLALRIGMYSTGTPGHPGLHPVVIQDSSGRSMGDSGVAAKAVVAPPRPAPAGTAETVRYDLGVTMTGYDVAREGPTLTVTPRWHAGGPLPLDYTVFVHVLDAAGKVVAQDDSQPLSGGFPTTFWRSGDQFADPHRIKLPGGLPPGNYRLEFGLYDLATSKRLAVLAGSPEAPLTLTGGS